jgi:transposase
LKLNKYFPSAQPEIGAAMRQVLHGRGRMEQEKFTKFHANYNFRPRFCTAAAHEKGAIEGLMGYVKRNYFVPLPEPTVLRP